MGPRYTDQAAVLAGPDRNRVSYRDEMMAALHRDQGDRKGPVWNHEWDQEMARSVAYYMVYHQSAQKRLYYQRLGPVTWSVLLCCSIMFLAAPATCKKCIQASIFYIHHNINEWFLSNSTF
jgi:hypothetical protein